MVWYILLGGWLLVGVVLTIIDIVNTAKKKRPNKDNKNSAKERDNGAKTVGMARETAFFAVGFAIIFAAFIWSSLMLTMAPQEFCTYELESSTEILSAVSDTDNFVIGRTGSPRSSCYVVNVLNEDGSYTIKQIDEKTCKIQKTPVGTPTLERWEGKYSNWFFKWTTILGPGGYYVLSVPTDTLFAEVSVPRH